MCLYPEFTVLDVYLFGSRMYQCHKPSSDYDFVVIVDGVFFYSSKLIEPVITLDTGESIELNLSLFHVEYYQNILNSNFINAIMTYYAPDDYILQKKSNLTFKMKIPSIQRAGRFQPFK